ncbi:MAG: BatA domain-containing protein, partial [Planctomycetia bacterium]
MPTFDFPALVWWGLPLVAAPLIIHLINLLRHRQVRWAAMEFLLASQRKYRTRVLLKQILLLCLRVAAVLGVVLALAQPRWQHALGQLLGGGRTSHIVLLDDSGSMGDLTAGDRLGETSAFDRGRLVVERIAGELAAAAGAQELTLGRFSVLEQASGEPAREGQPARFDLERATAAPESVQRVRDELAGFACSQTDAGPRAALAAARDAFTAGSAAARVLWLVTDFRAR